MPYTAEINRNQPTAFIFVIDQSRSMVERMSSGKSKAEFVADVLNKTIYQLIIRSTRADDVRDNFDLGILAYSGSGVGPGFGGPLSANVIHPLSAVAQNPLRIETRNKKVDDGAGGLVEQGVKFPIWFDPQTADGTPTCEALRQVASLLADWCNSHKTSYPPTVIHITDGQSTDGDPEEIATQVQRISTADGPCLLFNLHINTSEGKGVIFPNTESGLPDTHSKMLFRCSSPFPPHLIEMTKQSGYPVTTESKYFGYQVGIEGIFNFVDIGTRPTPHDPLAKSQQALDHPSPSLSPPPKPSKSPPPKESEIEELKNSLWDDDFSPKTIEFGPDGFPVGMPAGTPPPASSNWEKPSVSPHPSSTVEFGPDGFPAANYADAPISQSQALPPVLSEAIATDRGQFAPTKSIKRDEVDCTVFCPLEVAQGHSMMVQVFTHVPEKAEEAEVKAKKYDQQAEERGYTSLGTEIARGSKLLFKLQMDGARVQPDTQQLIWRGRTASGQFGVSAPKDGEAGTLLGTLVVSQDSVPIGTIVFSTNIVKSTASTKSKSQVAGAAQRYQKAFISYASQNRNEVLRRIQMLSRVGIGTFFDLFSLKAGDAYSDKLLEYIDQSDVMFLFWSTAAKKSAWVEKEWRYGLSHKPEGFIQPVIIEGPPAPLPPPELEHLHFNDTVIYFVSESLLTRFWRSLKGLIKS